VVYAGSERVAEALAEAFPGTRLLTTMADDSRMPAALHGARTSFLQHVPGAQDHHEWLVPLMPLAWRLLPVPDDVDVVISSSHACAKGVRVPEGVPHVCYCHTPMRYAWDFQAERERFPAALRPLARAGMTWFRRWDERSARRVTRFVANSEAVAGRIRSFYGRDADVVHPPVRTEFFTPGGERGDAFLYVGRLTGYKRPDLVVAAFEGLPYELVVVGGGAALPELRRRAPANVRFVERVTDEELRDLYRRSRALVYPVDEDFGIVMAEAQACGTPVIGLARGGARDIVAPGETGWLVERQDVEELRAAIRRAAEDELDPSVIRASAERFAVERFQATMREIVADTL
jgi:glycosyltransferase involved in cell wall biosynthesis